MNLLKRIGYNQAAIKHILTFYFFSFYFIFLLCITLIRPVNKLSIVCINFQIRYLPGLELLSLLFSFYRSTLCLCKVLRPAEHLGDVL